MGRKVRDGNSARVTVPASTTVLQGAFTLLNGFFGVATQEAVNGVGVTKDIVLNTEQSVYETSQITVANAFAIGDLVYWDNATKLLTTAAAAGANRLVGRVYAAKDGNNVIELLLGPQVQ